MEVSRLTRKDKIVSFVNKMISRSYESEGVQKEREKLRKLYNNLEEAMQKGELQWEAPRK